MLIFFSIIFYVYLMVLGKFCNLPKLLQKRFATLFAEVFAKMR